MDSCIGNCICVPMEKSHYEESGKFLAPSMRRCQDLLQREAMYGKRKRGSKEPSTNLEPCQSEEMILKTGIKSSSQPSPVALTRFHQMSWFVITQDYGTSAQIMDLLKELKKLLKSFGAQLASAKVGKRGKTTPLHFLRIHDPNSGVDTEVKRLLLLMNFGEISTFHIYYDGVIGTLSVWKSKVALSRLLPTDSYLLRILTRLSGIPTWIPKLITHYDEDLPESCNFTDPFNEQ